MILTGRECQWARFRIGATSHGTTPNLSRSEWISLSDHRPDWQVNLLVPDVVVMETTRVVAREWINQRETLNKAKVGTFGLQSDWDANDDLPPADVCRGQELVRGVYDLLSNVSTWDHTLLVITYDEHGGFFDHSVPAGMPGSAHPTSFPRVHPLGADHLGVRVPTFVVSPWIDAGTVIKTLFDHTSILKTIIERFAPAQFPIADVFGQRAATANELLSELKWTTVRQDQPPIPEIECHSRTSPAGPTAQLDGTDFVTSMRLLGLPPLYRGRLVI